MNGVFLDDCKEMFREYAAVSLCCEKIQAIGIIGFAALVGVAYYASWEKWTAAGESFRMNFDRGYTMLFPGGEEDILLDDEAMNGQAWETAFHLASLMGRPV
ncbi:MAG TPA: hypothetical protein DCE71_02510 [Parachlamydiales bacterium]|nr:hypothetical protein [Parachlamydiales bacterium]